MKTGNIKQTVYFNASPKEVYTLLMDSKKHSSFTGSMVKMSQIAKGRFSVFDGYCNGYNIQLIEGKKIIQAWHFAEEGWPPDHFSVCTFNFKKNVNGTKLEFIQKDVPEHKVLSISNGWKEHYWEPMKEYLIQNKK